MSAFRTMGPQPSPTTLRVTQQHAQFIAACERAGMSPEKALAQWNANVTAMLASVQAKPVAAAARPVTHEEVPPVVSSSDFVRSIRNRITGKPTPTPERPVTPQGVPPATSMSDYFRKRQQNGGR